MTLPNFPYACVVSPGLFFMFIEYDLNRRDNLQ